MRKSKKSQRNKRFKKSKTSSALENLDTDKYLDREISFLEFQLRVLEQAKDKRIPILERLKFLNIFSNNLDEFFMKDVASSKFLELSDSTNSYTKIRMKIIRKNVSSMLNQASSCFENDIALELKKHNLEIATWNSLDEKEKKYLSNLFSQSIFPVLTPLAVDSAHPFPHISNLSVSLAVSLRHPDKKKEILFSRVKIPNILPSWYCINPDDTSKKQKWISTKNIVQAHLHLLFPKMEILNSMLFKVTRNIELEKDDAHADDILSMIEEELHERKFGEVVKLEHGENKDEWLINFLIEELEITKEDVFENKSDNVLVGFKSILKAEHDSNMVFAPWTPLTSHELSNETASIFSIIRKQDLLLHHPYESYSSSVERFIYDAARDPRVLIIKMTLYRTNEESSLIRSLIRAVQLGKQVVVLVELKARFDEERNISWAKKLEEYGIHIVYGIVGLKTHSKTALVVRKEYDLLKSYAHIGTGNYHSQTAKLYTDFSLLTANKKITKDLTEFFHFLTGRSLQTNYLHLLVAPVNMKQKFIKLIDNEIANAKKGLPAHIMLKINNIEYLEMCQKLYEASTAGVKVDILARTICALKPGIKGLSENITVYSIVDRFLEHSRLYIFADGSKHYADHRIYIGSADWMYRNLQNRIEMACPIFDERNKLKCIESFNIMLKATNQRWTLNADGTYKRTTNTNNEESAQAQLMKLYKKQHKR